MTNFVVDTNVLSELSRARPSPAVVAWLTMTPAQAKYLSVLSVGEVRAGVEGLRGRDDARALALDLWLQNIVREFDARILPVTIAVADRWGELTARGSLPYTDGLIAATALVHGLTVVTRDVRDFESTGVPILNPFEA
jgi:toxin FitB